MRRLADLPNHSLNSPRSALASVRMLLGLGLTLLMLGVMGCSRSFWRQNANDNGYDVLNEKIQDPRWSPPRTDVTPDPRSRFFDPSNPDCPPLPPDDPAANQYMNWMGGQPGARWWEKPWPGGVAWGPFKRVQGFRGYRGWHKFGQEFSVENPQWLAPYVKPPEEIDPAVDKEPVYLPRIENLTLRQANELALIHSRDFQFQIESLFLTALALTFDRFQFKIRYLGLNSQRPTAVLTQTDVPHTSDQLGLSSRGGISQVLPTGGQWIVELANNTIWLFSSDKTNTASTLSYSLVQPLLLGAGRKVVLENLTQSERNLLYAVRNFARFRQSFFTSVVSGNAGGSLPGSISPLVSETAATGQNNGSYLQILSQTQSIRNQRLNIQLLSEQVERLQTLAAAKSRRPSTSLQKLPAGFVIPDAFEGRLLYNAETKKLIWSAEEMTPEELEELLKLTEDDPYRLAIQNIYDQINTNIQTRDVTQLQSQIANQTTTLLNAERTLQDQLDGFKILLGVPTDTVMSLDLRMLDPFQLIDPRVTDIQRRIEASQKTRVSVDEDNPRLAQVRPLYEEMLAVRREIENILFPQLDEDFRQMEERYPERLEEIEDNFFRDELIANFSYDKRQYHTYRTIDYKAETERLEALEKVFKKPTLTTPEITAAFDEVKGIQEHFLSIVQSLTVVQINIRVQLIKLNKFAMTMEEATQTGLENRLDLMNSRSTVMDARRKMEVSANQLRSILNIVIQGNINTHAINTQPLEFIGSESNYRAGLNFTAPLDQVAQRNSYRASQITYQRARRDYMLAEDQTKFSVRQAWRQVNVNRRSFEVVRGAVRIAARGLDQSVELSKDPRATTNTANGLQLINALGNVLSAQQNLISNWINYETNRLIIYRDMGIMFIDETGLWDDEYYQTLGDSNPTNAPAPPAPPDVPAEDLVMPAPAAEATNENQTPPTPETQSP